LAGELTRKGQPAGRWKYEQRFSIFHA